MNDTLPTVVPTNPIPGNLVMHLVHLIYVSRFTPVCDTVALRNIDTQLIAQYCPHARFEPYSMGAVIAREFMLAAARAHARDNDRSLSKVH